MSRRVDEKDAKILVTMMFATGDFNTVHRRNDIIKLLFQVMDLHGLSFLDAVKFITGLINYVEARPADTRRAPCSNDFEINKACRLLKSELAELLKEETQPDGTKWSLRSEV